MRREKFNVLLPTNCPFVLLQSLTPSFLCIALTWANSFYGSTGFPSRGFLVEDFTDCDFALRVCVWQKESEVTSATSADGREKTETDSFTCGMSERVYDKIRCCMNLIHGPCCLHQADKCVSCDLREWQIYRTSIASGWDKESLSNIGALMGRNTHLAAICVCLSNYLINLFRTRATELFTGLI